MNITEYKVGDVKCIDDGRTKGVIIGCEGRNLISLIFDGSVSHTQTDELVRTLIKMNLREVAIQKG
jgi:hypothetical protein